MYENLPLYLKSHGAFCGYRLVKRNGKKSKVPFDLLTGSHARSNDRSCFCGFETALQHENGYDGLGVGIFDDLVGIDIDDCIQSDGSLSSLAQDVIETMNSYTEVSPSGEGIRIFARAGGLSFDKSRYYVNNRHMKLEVYIAGHTNKFLTVTGDVIRPIDVCTRPTELLELLERYMKRPDFRRDAAISEQHSYLSDETVISKLLAGKHASVAGRYLGLRKPQRSGHGTALKAGILVQRGR
jgi:putative DNA primase/helicase